MPVASAKLDATPIPAPSGALLATLIAPICLGLILMTLCLPSMQEWAAIFAVPQSTVQLTFSAFVVAFGGLQLVFGPLSDRHGRRRIMLIGLALSLAGSFLGVVAGDINTLIAARFMQGAGCAATSVAGRAAIQDYFDGAARTRAMAYVGMAMGLCPPLATVLGGHLHEAWGWGSNFVLASALSAGMAVLAWQKLPHGLPPAQRRLHAAGTRDDGEASLAAAAPPRASWVREAIASFARLLREPGFAWLVVVMGFTAAAFYAFLSAAPLVLRSYGVGPAGVGWYVMVVPLAYIVGNMATARFAQRLGDQRLMGLGHAISISGIALMLALAYTRAHTPLAFALPLLLFGIGHGLSVPTTLARAVGVLPALAGAASALGGVMQQLIGAVGGYLVGFLNLDDGPQSLGWLMLASTLVSALAVWRSRPRQALPRHAA